MLELSTYFFFYRNSKRHHLIMYLTIDNTNTLQQTLNTVDICKQWINNLMNLIQTRARHDNGSTHYFHETIFTPTLGESNRRCWVGVSVDTGSTSELTNDVTDWKRKFHIIGQVREQPRVNTNTDPTPSTWTQQLTIYNDLSVHKSCCIYINILVSVFHQSVSHRTCLHNSLVDKTQPNTRQI